MKMPSRTTSSDQGFVQAMKAHHQDALTMANNYLKVGDDPMLRSIAHNIIQTQTTEIRKFDLWLKRNAKQR